MFLYSFDFRSKTEVPRETQKIQKEIIGRKVHIFVTKQGIYMI